MKKNPTKNNTKLWSLKIVFKEFLLKSNVVLSPAVSEARALQMTYAKRSVAIVYKIYA